MSKVKYVAPSCPNCGASLNIPSYGPMAFCPFCGSRLVDADFKRTEHRREVHIFTTDESAKAKAEAESEKVRLEIEKAKAEAEVKKAEAHTVAKIFIAMTILVIALLIFCGRVNYWF